ncbi:hypothetical protein [Pectobacterium parvum]|uniref:GH18 domain-containing protein n=1 Tax=Pectobacterium parvum TaxID=2778550 RepID=A0AAP9ILR9_9GAMM|nr:hypothetical protein [Pectobacterium parvum]QHQ25714.1 hypothetical protein GMX10_17960 [Pectobacterium parvum]
MANMFFRSNGQPFFSEVVLFAANINGDNAQQPQLFYNEQLSAILNDNISIVRALQSSSIKVQIAYLGNHQTAGWSANMDFDTCVNLATMMVADVTKYNLDGIFIDDGYSAQSGN